MRSSSRAGAIGTLIGNGWLRESPRERDAPHGMAGWGWNARSKSALRKCMFMPVPEEIRRLVPQLQAPYTPSAGFGGPQVSQAALPPHASRVSRPEPEIVPSRRDPRKDAREFPAYVAGRVVDPQLAAQQAHAFHVQNAQKLAQQQAVAAAGKAPQQWWEDPVALGSLLILVPPIGLAAVWSSKHYSSDARWALTVMTALTMCLMSAIFIAALAMH